MMNVIRMEIYRMFHSVSFYTTILLCAAMAGVLLLSQSNSINKYYDSASSQETAGVTVKDKKGGDVYVAGNDDETGIAAGDAVNIASPGNVCDSYITSAHLFEGIFMALFVGSFYAGGYCKNVLGKVRRKGYFQAARLACVTIYAAMILAFTTVVTVALAALLIHAFTFANMGEFALFLLGEYLLLVACGTMFCFFTDLFRSKIPSLVYAVLLGTTLVLLIETVINNTAEKLLHKEFFIQHYLPSLYASDYRYGSLLGGGVEDVSKMLIHAAVLSICALVVYNGLGALALSQKDV